MEIRLLGPDDIEVRAQQVTAKGAVLLLYKNARVDMAILDECFGPLGWQREHSFKDGNNYCKVSIYDAEHNQWVSKEDVGTESNTEKEKGQASDAFKRACFNVGIGRELYTAPFVWVALSADEVTQKGSKYALDYKVRFSVAAIDYNDSRAIRYLKIVDQKGNVRYETGKRIGAPASGEVKTAAPDPIPSAQPLQPQGRKVLPTSTLNDPEASWKIMGWVYKAHRLAKDPSVFDPVAYLCRVYDVSDEAKELFAQLYDSYVQAQENNNQY